MDKEKEQDIKKEEKNEEELPFCESTHTPEQQRPMDKDEPCDSGIKGKI